MRRRSLLATLGVGVAGAASALGRAARPRDDRRDRDLPWSGGNAVPPEPETLPVPESELRRAAARDAIPAIVDPAYGPDWSVVDREGVPRLADGDEVLGVVRDGRARAYPLPLLDRHEVVNDAFGDPLLVTYCPVCRSGVVADRRVAGAVRTFGVSGLLYGANLVLYDRASDSEWSQLLATAIRGPLTGTSLSVRPSSITTWGGWRRDHPETEVLLPPPASSTVVGDVAVNYNVDVYDRRREIARRHPEYGVLGDLEWSDTRLRRRTLVLGVAAGDAARAYPLRLIRAREPIEDVVSGRPAVVALAGEDAPVAYDRRVGGRTLSFSAGDGGTLRAGGSRWAPWTGEAIDGPYRGRRLRPASAVGRLYWAAWLTFHPETDVYGEG